MHTPVLATEVIDHLNLEPNDNAIDCTVGDGCHSKFLLEKSAPEGRLLAIDADRNSLSRARKNLTEFDQQRITFKRNNFRNLEKIVEETGLKDIQAILFDLGWSTSQLEDKKGFSFQNKEKLDMRYGDKGKTASELVNNLPKDELDFIFRRYGEEKFSNKIAREIVDKREDNPIETTNQLVDIILKVYRNKLNSDKEVPWTGGTHPATQVFQALRISVNKELKSLKQALPQAVEVLDNLGRIAVISFHSLEDRIVKHFFKDNEDKLEIITRSPITPAESELEQNPKARSAKLRVAEKNEKI